LCETSEKNLRTNVDVTLIISKIKETPKKLTKKLSKHPAQQAI
jgi:hypothetical protein